MAIAYHENYSNTIIMIYVAFILKKTITETKYPLYVFGYHIISGLIFIIMKKLYSYNEVTLKYMPIVVALYSYYCHTNMIFHSTLYSSNESSSSI